MNLIDKAVNIQLGTVEASLKFGWNAIALLEETTGKPLTDLIGYKDRETGEAHPGDISKVPFSSLRLLVWAGIHHQMPLTVNEVGDLLDNCDVKSIGESVTKALGAQLAKPASLAPEGQADPNVPATAING